MPRLTDEFPFLSYPICVSIRFPPAVCTGPMPIASFLSLTVYAVYSLFCPIMSTTRRIKQGASTMEMNPDPLSAGVSVILFEVATIDRRFCLVSGLPTPDRCTSVGINFS
ncbi:hypothetical protein BDV34DRAFT_139341 [Aspergillus parasiticus]|uniref:Uncharacterized protein n=1 Tax=Aspergillus parasiticus TaxID=5067 RepID=A0A5N6DZL6_ASPPA|nr:hypothetical protein BDV34DRAFT_139341 [Aspergillus parasiticus]